MNGVTLAREARLRRDGLKVLLMTGYTEAALERYDVSGTEFDVIGKPYGRSELARKACIVLDGPTGVS
jgi:two-component SAPR family response regulator